MRIDRRSVRRRLGGQLLPAEDRGTRHRGANRREDAQLQGDLACPGRSWLLPGARLRRWLTLGIRRRLWEQRHAHAGRSANRCPAHHRTSDVTREGLHGRRGTATYGSRTSTTGASCDSHAATGAAETVDSGAINPDSPVVDGDVVWVGDWSKPQVVRLPAVGAARPHSISLPVHHTACPTILLRVDRRGGCRCHLGDNAGGPRALAHRSEHERRETNQPARTRRPG